jgi:peptidoglycan DL-endopeptidase CwlO
MSRIVSILSIRRTVHLLVVAALVAGAASVLTVPSAGADPIADKQAEAKAIQNQIDANGEQISALDEQANGARLRLSQAEQEIAAAQARADEAQRKAEQIRELLKKRGASAYRGAVSGRSLDTFDVDSVNELLSGLTYAEATAQHDQDLLDELKAAKREAAKQRDAADQARADAEREQQRIAQSQRDLKAATAQQQQILSKVQGDLAQLVAQEQQRREEEAAREAAARYASTATADNGTGSVGTSQALPAPSGGAATAIAFARAQIGKPYCSGGAGPDCYDCSGLTMRAWGAAGVSMPHYSGAQYDMFPKVPLSQMEPGDLVFWGPGGSDHVGLYIGGGQMIAAPHTGDVVKQQAVYGSPSGAVRPG